MGVPGSDADLSRQTITKDSEGIHSLLQPRSSSSRDRATDTGILREGLVDLEREDNLRAVFGGLYRSYYRAP
jgi:hypothetical protein